MHQLKQSMMKRCFSLAREALGHTNPNPLVGCVITSGHDIVAEGFHTLAGKEHAEVKAIQALAKNHENLILYVNLEPCCHHGKTPPCTEAIIKSGIKHVVIGMQDPNPLVSGQGIERLKEAGITVEVGILEQQAMALNPIFNHHIQHNSPHICAKWAMSMDGKSITSKQDSRIISSSESFTVTQNLRQYYDAIVVGSQTVIDDNPSLNVRAPSIKYPKHPLRVILDARGRINTQANVFQHQTGGSCILITSKQLSQLKKNLLRNKGVDIWEMADDQGHIHLDQVIDQLYREKRCYGILFEPGPTLRNSLIQDNLVHQYHAYVAPILIGSRKKRTHISPFQTQACGNNVYIQSEALCFKD